MADSEGNGVATVFDAFKHCPETDEDTLPTETEDEINQVLGRDCVQFLNMCLANNALSQSENSIVDALHKDVSDGMIDEKSLIVVQRHSAIMKELKREKRPDYDMSDIPPAAKRPRTWNK